METKKLLNKKITQWLLLVAMLVGCSASAWASNIYITAPGGTRINVYTFSGCNAGNWPGKNVTTNAIAYDQGGFYSFTSCSTTSSYSYIINNSSQQTGNLSLSEDTWGYYNNNTSFSVLMKNSTLSSVSCQFASSSISGWDKKVTATWDSSEKKFKYPCTNWGGSSGIDVYLGGTKFLYKSCTQSTGNYIIYWDPYTGNFTFESACTAPTIDTHPSNTDKTYCQNAAATALSVTASGTAPLSYQWKQSTSASGTYSNVTSGTGATTATYTPSTATAGTTYYKCYVSNSCGNVTSNASGAITVNTNTMALTSITLSPSSACVNETSTITPNGLVLAGGSISYTSGATSVATVENTTVTAVAPGSSVITATVSGGCGSTVTKTATFTVNGVSINQTGDLYEYNPITFTASSSATWSLTTESETAYISATSGTSTVLKAKAGTYTVTGTKDGCDTQKQVTIVAWPNKCN